MCRQLFELHYVNKMFSLYKLCSFSIKSMLFYAILYFRITVKPRVEAQRRRHVKSSLTFLLSNDANSVSSRHSFNCHHRHHCPLADHFLHLLLRLPRCRWVLHKSCFLVDLFCSGGYRGGPGPPIIIIIINKVLIKVTLNKVIAWALYIVIRIVIVIPISPCPVGGRVAQEKRTSASWSQRTERSQTPTGCRSEVITAAK